MSALTVDSNINAVLARLNALGSDLQAEYEVSIENHVSYAAAVDQGSTRMMDATQPVTDREAATEARHAKYGAPKWDGDSRFAVTRGETWTKVVIPPAGIMLQSYPLIKAHGRDVLRQLGPAFGDSQVSQAMREDMANGAQAILVSKTMELAFDQGVLAGGWKVRPA